jgi:hypothetical protein
MSTWKVLLLLSTALALTTACQSNRTVPVGSATFASDFQAAETGNAVEDYVATDLVSALMQLPDYDPWRTTIQINKADTKFDAAVEKALRNGNFGVQIVANDLGQNYLSTETATVESNAAAFDRYRLVLGSIIIERDYKVIDDQPYPESLIKLSGHDPVDIALYPDLFIQDGGDGVTFPSGVMFRNQRGEWVPQQERYITINQSRQGNNTDLFTHERFLVLAKTQAYFSKRQTRTVDIRRWAPVSQLKIVFPEKDTSYMGVNNKRAVVQLLNNFNPDSHGISITGCQNKTLLWDGTQSDSLDRQLRVRRELFAAGISPDVVQENGCFPSEFSSLLTPNAVIITLHQRPI